jgi:hypothetical protein
MSAQLQVTGEAKIRDIQGPVVANDGVITALDGAASQYVRGDGTLADFPTSSGGGSSVSYYLNSSVSQGTIGGVAYRELSKDPIIGAGTDIAISSNGYVANYITDANDPDVVLVPGGNFNCEFYFSVNNNTGNPTTYAELYKYDGTTFTLLGSNVGVPESINQGTTIAPYYFAIPVATASLAITDRLAIRIYVNVSGRTVTLHTENGHLCQVVTTLSKGMVSLNNLTDQSQYLTTGTSGTNFSIASSGDTHTFNLPIASATNTGKLSSTDWSTFNNKQNALTNPITGTGASGNVAYFDGTTSITAENSFNYDASTNRLGVNTTVPNATIGANAGTDSGYSLLLKNDNANYNGIGFATTSTYGNVIGTEKLGTAPARNLTLLNQSGYISITEVGNLGVNILNPNTGLDIYNGTSAYLWLHTANSGITGTDGVRLALFSNNGANLRNFEGAMSITSEGDFQVITLGAENIRVNSADGKVGIGNPATLTSLLTVNGAITQSSVTSSLLKTNASGTLVAAVAGTDYVVPSALSGFVPTSRTITINGTTQNLSADISYSVGTITGGGADGRVAYYSGTSGITSDSGFIYESGANRLGVNTVSPNATIGSNAGLDSNYSLLLKNSDTNYNGLGFRIDSTYGHMIETTRTGSAIARNLTLINNGGFFSVSEAGNFGFNILAVNTGVDIYASTNTFLWLHNGANTGSTQGARLAYFGTKSLNLRNFEGPLSLSSEGDFQIITLGAENLRVNSANGYIGIGNPSTVLAPLHVYNAENAASLLLQTDGATSYSEIAVRNASSVATSYFRQYSASASGTDFGLSRSNLATFFSNFASNFAIGTMNGGDLIFGTANTERARITAADGNFGIGTTSNISARLTVFSSTEANQIKIGGAAPATVYADSLSTATYIGVIGLATASNNFANGIVAGDFVIGTQKNTPIVFITGTSTSQKMRLTNAGDLGIGTSAPDTKLDVRGEISLAYSASNGLRFYNQDRSNWSSISNTNTTSNANLVFRTSAGVALTLNNNRDASFTTNISAQQATFSSSVTAGGITTINTGAIGAGLSLDVNNSGTYGLIGVRRGTQTNASAGISYYTTTSFKWFTGIFENTDNFGFYNATNGTFPMVITTGNNVGIGTSSPVSIGGYTALTINGTSGSFTEYQQSGSYSFRIGSDSSIGGFISQVDANPIRIFTNSTERMIITSGGAVLIGSTTPVSGRISPNTLQSTNEIYSRGAFSGFFWEDRSNSANWYGWYTTSNTIFLYNGSANAASINPSTGIYTPLSDINKKKDFEASTIGLDAILGLKPTLYRMTDEDNTEKHLGFIAQEVKEFIPQAYVESEDFIGLNYNAIVAALVKSVQELKAEIEELKAMIAAK